MFGVGPSELIIILVLALIIFGPGKLPDVGKAIGRSIREFKAASSSIEEGVKEAVNPTTPATTTTTTTSQETAQPAAATASTASNSEPVVDGRASS